MSALINYTTIAFVTEFEMNEMIKHIDATSKVWAPEMKKRGLKRFVCTRIWNKGDTFKLGILFEYDTKEAFQNTIEYLDELLIHQNKRIDDYGKNGRKPRHCSF